jgi:Na+/melibiose symporter-like transporter
MGVRAQDFLVLAVALVTAAGCAYYYVVAVLDEHRALSRSAALAFFVFSLVAAVFFMRILRA